MCELLGMSFNAQIRPNWTFKVFRHRGNYNADGWGIAFYPDNEPSAQIIKEKIKSTDSDLSKKLIEYPKWNSKIIIAHVRRKSNGDAAHMNSHPFTRELAGKEYVFAHNGTILDYQSLQTGRFKPIGETDSEHVFCSLLNAIENRKITAWNMVDFKWLEEFLRGINKMGIFHCLFSDGDFLFCFCSQTEYNRLKILHRKPPYSGKCIRLRDDDLEINLGEEKDSGQAGYIISTNPLTKGEPWLKLNLGTLQVFRNGQVIYPVSWDESALEIEPSETTFEQGVRPRVSSNTNPSSQIPIREVKFASMAEAIVAVRESYATFTGSTHKGDWLSNGRAWYKKFHQKYIVNSNDVPRDPHVPEITEIAFALCVDAVMRRSLKVKFLPRQKKQTHIYGGGEDNSFNGKRQKVMVLAPAAFTNNADIHDLMAAELFSIESSGNDHIYLRMSFRESKSDLRYIIVALYILWIQKYIQLV